ncbi:hypothetical protein SAMN05421741_103125 [Paenimyroides ummariense]|uniref:YD repeat-containing protein n=1 Tax=Paenimyroides ummariense TaxID=913024 RepID=A0A1I4XUD6_9FLAO|nr:hypothetical protein [Paenimyroides ummariense]SFN28993.1 hypothetical protein SAMN05421741_103125 [Paenimyroides ummariense]
MKKLLLYILFLFMIACSTDDEANMLDLPEIETPLHGLRIKQVEGDNTTQYFYHKNGFVDSISFIGENIIAEKFVYNDVNQIIEKRFVSKKASDTNFSIYNTSYFTYNNKKQIIFIKTYNKNNTLASQQSLTYNDDGSLYNPTQIVKDGNLVQQNASQRSTIFTFDTNPNPFFNIYPKAYRVAFYINKNNITSQKTTTPYYTNFYEYQLKYNSENFIIEKINHNNPANSRLSRYYYY